MNADPTSSGAGPQPPVSHPENATPKHGLNPAKFGAPIQGNPKGFDASARFRHFQPHRGFSAGIPSPAAREHARGRHNG